MAGTFTSCFLIFDLLHYPHLVPSVYVHERKGGKNGSATLLRISYILNIFCFASGTGEISWEILLNNSPLPIHV